MRARLPYPVRSHKPVIQPGRSGQPPFHRSLASVRAGAQGSGAAAETGAGYLAAGAVPQLQKQAGIATTIGAGLTTTPGLRIQRSGEGTYQPESGDTWTSIAHKFSLTLVELIALNADKYRYNADTKKVTDLSGSAVSPNDKMMLKVPSKDSVGMGGGDTGKLEMVKVEGVAFLKGGTDGHVVAYNDVDQGALGDCSLMAGMAAIAHANPDFVHKLIKPLGDGKYEVTLYVDSTGLFSYKVKHTETVTHFFPGKSGTPWYADPGDRVDGVKELWPMLLEKALAQYLGGYHKIESRSAKDMMTYLTGKTSTYYKVADYPGTLLLAYIKMALSMDKPVTVGSKDSLPSGVSKDIVADHAYAVIDVDLDAKTLNLYNPHGPSRVHLPSLSASDFKSAFESVTVMDEALK